MIWTPSASWGNCDHREEYLASYQPRSSVASHHLLCIFLAGLTTFPCPMCPIRLIRPIDLLDPSDSSDPSDLLDPSDPLDPTVPKRRVPEQTALFAGSFGFQSVTSVPQQDE